MDDEIETFIKTCTWVTDGYQNNIIELEETTSRIKGAFDNLMKAFKEIEEEDKSGGKE